MSKFKLTFLLAFAFTASAEVPKGVRFRADFYQRDLTHNTLKGKGNAWLQTGGREVSADEIEVDFEANRALTTGNVRMKEGDIHIACSHAQFNMKGQDAVFDKATITMGQMIFTGEVIRRLSATEYDVEEGSYSNCNTSLAEPPAAADCSMDWRFSGRRFKITLGGYAHFYDVLASARGIPFLYSPYLVVPVKTERETGFLLPAVPWTSTLGNGVTLPFFWAMSDWQDLLISPTYYSATGTHLGLQYRYRYSDDKNGYFNLFMVSRRFSGPDNPGPDNAARGRWLGMFGEGAVEASNIFRFSGSRAHSQQMINFVTNPYYTFDYAGEVGSRASLGNLRSQLTYTHPTDEWLFTAQAQYLQPLSMSIANTDNINIDGGGAAQLPVLNVSKTTSPFWGQLFSYELDTQFTNFTRNTSIDTVTPTTVATTPALTSNAYYVRTGRRLQVEPRLVANIPMPAGFQLQPLLRTGALLYHFDAPFTGLSHREYMELEIPVALQLSRVFHTSIDGFEKISHVFQPRFVFASSLVQTGDSSHAFYYEDTARSLSNPRFDILDQFIPFQYMRFELINRFQRKRGDSLERFFWFQLSEQYNLITTPGDPRYAYSLGPVELFSALSLGNFSLQLTASFPLQAGSVETSFSAGVAYRGAGKNQIAVNGLYRKSANNSLNAQMANLYVYQELPTFFDFEGRLEYNFLTQKIYEARIGLHFQSKPRACWGFSIAVGQTLYGVPFTNFNFRLDKG